MPLKVKSFRLTPISGQEMFELNIENSPMIRIIRIDGQTYKLEECDGLQPCDCGICEEHRSW